LKAEKQKKMIQRELSSQEFELSKVDELRYNSAIKLMVGEAAERVAIEMSIGIVPD